MMSTQRPIISQLDTRPPADILNLELIKEFLNLDPDIDVEQDLVLSELRGAVIEDGEHTTGIVWAAAPYLVERLNVGRSGAAIKLPLAPVFSVEEVRGKDANGDDVIIEPGAYVFIPSDIKLGRPWAQIEPTSLWPGQVKSFCVVCTAGWTDDSLPKSIKGWALNRIATLYDHREDLVTGTITASLPRHHAVGLLDRWLVMGRKPYA